jgi:predicted nucleotidyltransferase
MLVVAEARPPEIPLAAFEEELIERTQPVKLRRLTVPVAAIEDLIILRAVAARPQDLADIDIVLSAGHRLDLRRIRKTVAFFAKTLERPEIVEQLESLLARHKPPKER